KPATHWASPPPPAPVPPCTATGSTTSPRDDLIGTNAHRDAKMQANNAAPSHHGAYQKDRDALQDAPEKNLRNYALNFATCFACSRIKRPKMAIPSRMRSSLTVTKLKRSVLGLPSSVA